MEEQLTNQTTGPIPYNKTLSGKSSGKSCLIALLIGVGSIATLVFLILLIMSPFSYRIHFGDRVKGSITVTLDGEPVDVKELDCIGDGVGLLKAKYNGNTVRYSMKGNDKELYIYTCFVGEGLLTVKLNYAHLNWWEQSDTEIEIGITSSEDGSYTYEANIYYKYLTEANKWKTNAAHESGSDNEGVITIGYGF